MEDFYHLEASTCPGLGKVPAGWPRHPIQDSKGRGKGAGSSPARYPTSGRIQNPLYEPANALLAECAEAMVIASPLGR
jgi:hypothetical protein